MLSKLSKNIFHKFSFFSHIPTAPLDPIIGISIRYMKDQDPKKVNLGVGAYRDQNQKPYIFNVVRKAQKTISQQNIIDQQSQRYSIVDGSPLFNKCSRELLFGKNSQSLRKEQVISMQSISGTGSLRLGFDFIKKCAPAKILIPNPTWANHHNLVTAAGLEFQEYPYYNFNTKKVMINEFVDYLNKAQEDSVVLLHVCAHNPTGMDPTEQQWGKIADVMKKRKLFPFFDSAYQGFASGDPDKDAYALRYFAENGFQFAVAQSYSKNMGLYGERAGALHILAKKDHQNITNSLRSIASLNYDSPPLHSAKIVQTVLKNPQTAQEWRQQIKKVANRIIDMRHALRKRLEENGAPGTWNHITDQIGMFSFTGLSEAQCVYLIQKHHIYLALNGRVSMPGLNPKNVVYVADCIKDALINIK